jgi:hypothetical protein
LPLVSLSPAANLPQVLLTRVATLPLVSTTPVVPVEKFSAGVVDSGVILNFRKFANLFASQSAPPESLIRVHGALGLANTFANFQKIQNDPELGEDDS